METRTSPIVLIISCLLIQSQAAYLHHQLLLGHPSQGHRLGVFVNYDPAGDLGPAHTVKSLYPRRLEYNAYRQQTASTVHFGVNRPPKGQDGNCYQLPLSAYYNISENSYFYPKNNIFEELNKRKDVLEEIFKNGVQPLSPFKEIDTLYSILPGTPRCHNHEMTSAFSECWQSERSTAVWAWCETLPYGKRITKIFLPLPVDCRCKEYQC